MDIEKLLDEVFTYHPPDQQDATKYQRLREAAREFSKVIVENTPACADRMAALRKVREAVMTANAAVALKGAV